MKKLLAAMLTLALLLAVPAALASELPHRPTPTPEPRFVGPEELLGETPELFQKDYYYEGRNYDVYFLPIPDDPEGFLNDWSDALAGFVDDLDRREIDGYDCLVIRHSTLLPGAKMARLTDTSYFFPDYDGEMMFMADQGLGYAPADVSAVTEPDPEPVPEPAPSGKPGGNFKKRGDEPTPEPELTPEPTPTLDVSGL